MTAGLTGGAGAGKSLVLKEFERLGAAVIDADAIAREAVKKGAPAYEEIVREFGPEFVGPDGELKRRDLGRAVFSDRGKLKKLNLITHPRIIHEITERMERMKKEAGDRVIIVDAPLLFEVALDKAVDCVITVCAKDDTCIERLMRRDGLTEAEARRILDAQIPMAQKKARADFVIDNNGTVEDTLRQARLVYESIKTTDGNPR